MENKLFKKKYLRQNKGISHTHVHVKRLLNFYRFEIVRYDEEQTTITINKSPSAPPYHFQYQP